MTIKEIAFNLADTGFLFASVCVVVGIVGHINVEYQSWAKRFWKYYFIAVGWSAFLLLSGAVLYIWSK